MALRFDLRPGERFYLNGAIIEVATKASILLHNKAAFVRCTDIMFETEATTLAKGIYFCTMKIALNQDGDGTHLARLMGAAGELVLRSEDLEMTELVREILELLESGRSYKALLRAKALITLEAQRLPQPECGFSDLVAAPAPLMRVAS